VPAPSQASAPPQPRAPAPPSTASDEPKSARRIEAEELLAKGDKATFFELLGITREANAADVQKAWAARAKQFHPDKATGDLAELRPQLEQLMAQITVAKDTLKDDEKRKDYLNSLDLSFDGKLKGPKPSRAPSHEDNLVRQALEADEAFMKAKILLKRNQLDEAKELAEMAAKADKENGDYMALYAWIEARQRPRKGNFDDLLQRLRDAVKLAPKSEDAHFYFAQLLYQTGKLRKALSEYEWAMDINPDNIDAVRMVRILRKKKAEAIRKRKEQKSGGLLASLFGDKKK
jgi:tetratricopeptide (TPR) repeat protein